MYMHFDISHSRSPNRPISALHLSSSAYEALSFLSQCSCNLVTFRNFSWKFERTTRTQNWPTFSSSYLTAAGTATTAFSSSSDANTSSVSVGGIPAATDGVFMGIAGATGILDLATVRCLNNFEVSIGYEKAISFVALW